MRRIIYFLFLFVLLQACTFKALRLNKEDVKINALKTFQAHQHFAIKDTHDIGIKQIKSDNNNEWFVAYNTVTAPPALLIYHVNKPDEAPHYISLAHKKPAKIDHVDFENITNDSNYELLVELHYDFDLSYQGREILILRKPFEADVSEIFNYPFEQVWAQIDSFDNTYGLPANSRRVENHADYEIAEGHLILRGVLSYRKNHLMEYRWDNKKEAFVLVFDKDLHESDDEEAHGGIVHKTKGSKRLLEVNAHEDGCKGYVVEDLAGHVIDVGHRIHDELLCSNTTALSDDGHYLIYTDNKDNCVELYDFLTSTNKCILPNLVNYEGVSEVIWTTKKPLRFAFITFNPEEHIKQTRIHVFTQDKAEHFIYKSYDYLVNYSCDPVLGQCAPQKDYDFAFQGYDKLRFRRDAESPMKVLNL